MPATLLTLVMLAVLVGLGTWQLQRLKWKTDLLARIEAGMQAAPLNDPDMPTVPEFTHVRLHGKYPEASVIRLFGRTLDGVAGIHILQVFQPDNGKPTLIDRGFKPIPSGGGMAVPVTSGSITVEGIVRQPPERGQFDNDNDSARNQWYWIDLDAVSRENGGAALAPRYVELIKAPEGAEEPTPTGNLILSRIPNNHLQYAITWYALAAVLAVIYGVWVRQQMKAPR